VTENNQKEKAGGRKQNEREIQEINPKTQVERRGYERGKEKKKRALS
jgi:hypothetical protein